MDTVHGLSVGQWPLFACLVKAGKDETEYEILSNILPNLMEKKLLLMIILSYITFHWINVDTKKNQ